MGRKALLACVVFMGLSIRGRTELTSVLSAALSATDPELARGARAEDPSNVSASGPVSAPMPEPEAHPAAMIGMLIAFLSCCFNGSFPVCARFQRGAPIDPVLFNGIACVGVFLSSLPVALIAGREYSFTLGGLLGGSLFVFAALFSFLAIPLAGLAISQATWCCSAILVAFTWGAFGPSPIAQPMKSVELSFVALLLLIGGALIIVSCEPIAALFGGNRRVTDCADSRELDQELEGGGGVSASQGPSASRTATGILSALSVGLFGGSVLVPMKFVPQADAGLGSVFSFGLGALLAGLLVTGGYWYGIAGHRGKPTLPCDAVLAGLASGAMWNAGNVCSIIAQGPPFNLAYGIAYPILQCAAFFGGLWGILVFKEVQGKAIGVFTCGSLVLLVGIVCLSMFGPGAA